MADALIGHTGFVGGNLAAQHTFAHTFNSKNVEEIRGQEFDLLAVSAMPAAMWIANKAPDEDLAVLDRLWSCIREVRAKQVLVMSTVAVYPQPIGVDEDSPIDEAAQLPYGRHRLMLEQRVREHFAKTLVVRLPGLFGPGLKKNAIHDLLHNHETHKINAAGVYQFYNLDRLWQDISTCLTSGLEVVNFATEPVSIHDVARESFGLEFTNDPGGTPARFDMRSRHSAAFGGRNGYLYLRDQVLGELKQFVEREKQGAST